MKLIKQFEKETGYKVRFGWAIDKNEKSVDFAEYWEAYSKWLEKLLNKKNK
jgi:hypothetical protein